MSIDMISICLGAAKQGNRSLVRRPWIAIGEVKRLLRYVHFKPRWWLSVILKITINVNTEGNASVVPSDTHCKVLYHEVIKKYTRIFRAYST